MRTDRTVAEARRVATAKAIAAGHPSTFARPAYPVDADPQCDPPPVALGDLLSRAAAGHPSTLRRGRHLTVVPDDATIHGDGDTFKSQHVAPRPDAVDSSSADAGDREASVSVAAVIGPTAGSVATSAGELAPRPDAAASQIADAGLRLAALLAPRDGER